jgi:hypothetical protein
METQPPSIQKIKKIKIKKPQREGGKTAPGIALNTIDLTS